MKNWRILYVLLLLFHFADGKTYYLRSGGNDLSSGNSIATAWATIGKVNQQDLDPGDSVLFEGGVIFTGTLYLNKQDYGTATSPVVISTWGSGKATIYSGNNDGVSAYNLAGIVISNLIVKGSGANIGAGTGILFYMDTTAQLYTVTIDNCEVQGFRNGGIMMGAWSTLKGYADVEISNTISHDNGSCGIATYGFNNTLNHRNFTIRNCKAYNNKGLTSVTTSNTGNGIVLSGIDQALIEYCEAYNNGELNRNPNGGPVGIWFYLVDNGIIQHCESHHNKAGLTHDGGGFDIDGGCQNTIIQYCYSHDNEGAGYLLAEYGSGRAFRNNAVRYNISQNDGRKNGYGAVSVWGASSGAKVTNSFIYNNTIFVSDAGLVSGTASAFQLQDKNFLGVKIFNNIFYTKGSAKTGTSMYNVDSTEAYLVNNLYYSETGNFNISWANTVFPNLLSFRNNSKQEQQSGQPMGYQVNPGLVNPGTGLTIGNPHQLASALAAYQLIPETAICNTGIQPPDISGLSAVAVDFFGSLATQQTGPEIGAAESYCGAILPVQLLDWTYTKEQEGIQLKWRVSDNADIDHFQIERSFDGRNFIEINIVTPKQALSYSSIDSPNSGEKTLHYRLKIISVNGSIVYSPTLKISNRSAGSKILSVTSIPSYSTNSISLLVRTDKSRTLALRMYKADGSVIFERTISVAGGGSIVKLDPQTLITSGTYYIRIIDTRGQANCTIATIRSW